MKAEKPAHYEPHPISAERKAELLAKGVRIIDAIYAPEQEVKKQAKPRATKQEEDEE